MVMILVYNPAVIDCSTYSEHDSFVWQTDRQTRV